MKRPLLIIAAVTVCVLLAPAAVPGYLFYNEYRNLHRHPFGDFAAWESDFETLARIVDENRAAVGQYPAADDGGRLLELRSDGDVYIFASYPQNRYLPLTDAEKRAVASIRSRFGEYYHLRVYDGGFLLMGDNESDLITVLAHSENRRALRKMIEGKPFERRIVKLTDGWYCIFRRR